MLGIEPPGGRRGRSRTRFIYVTRENMHVVGITGRDTENKAKSKRMSPCGEHWWKQQKE